MGTVANIYLGTREAKTRDKIENIGHPVGILNKVIAIRMFTDDVEPVRLPGRSNLK